MQSVKQGAQIRVNLVVQGSGQETQALASLYCRTSENDSADFFALQCLNSLGHRQVGLSCSGWSNAKGNCVLVNRINVEFLTDSLRANALAPRRQDALTQYVGGAKFGFVDDLGRARNILRSQLLPARNQQHHLFDEILGTLNVFDRTGESKGVASRQYLDLGKSVL